jgi:wyosine [tRNA(Phe)-imidazoG37] synthetase (radical SAM superfamily)
LQSFSQRMEGRNFPSNLKFEKNMENANIILEKPVPLQPATLPASGIAGLRRAKTAIKFGPPRTSLGNRFVYAVISQRARGLSIGINMNPDKVCNFDCAYCEVSRDTTPGDRVVDLKALSTELEGLLMLTFQGKLRDLPYFRTVPEELLELKEVALSGDGEPTFSPHFEEIVREVIHIRSRRRFPFFKIVLITNSSGLDRPEVRLGLRHLTSEDEIWAKLDAGTQQYMDKVNHSTDVPLRKVLRNILAIARERPVVIQSLFPLFGGEEPPLEEIEAYVERLKELKAGGANISLVQVYSAHRAPKRPDCGHVPLKCLSHIAQRVREGTGLTAEVF